MESLKKAILSLVEKAGGTWGIAVEDLDQGEHWGYNDHLQFPAESVIKIPIMAGVFETVEKGKIRFSDEVLLRRKDIVGGSGILQHLSPGIRLPVRDLVTLVIIQSDNTATNLLIDLIGIEPIREIMAKAGMKDSEFNRKLMVYPQGSKNNLITTTDISQLLRALAMGTLLSHDSCEQMLSILKKQQILNGLPACLPSEEAADAGIAPGWKMASKSGWDTGRQHDVGILYTGGRTITVVALSQNVDARVALDTLGKIGKEIYLYASKH